MPQICELSSSPETQAYDLSSSPSPVTSICSFVKWHRFNKLKETDGAVHQAGSAQSTKVIKQLLAGAYPSLKHNNV